MPSRERKKDLIRIIVDELGRCALYAADPHCDCRDEISAILDQVGGLVEELLDDDDQADAAQVVPADLLARKGGGQ